MSELAPGSILQRMYLAERLQLSNARTFCEIGSGNGVIAQFLINLGMTGCGYDLNQSACQNNQTKNSLAIRNGNYKVHCDDFLTSHIESKFDLVLSCMVIEHLNDSQVFAYFEKCKSILTDNGTIVVLVPSSMNHWGIEDEIAGHLRRYDFTSLEKIAINHKLVLIDMAGLTFPLSNVLFRVSNSIVNKNEKHKKLLSNTEQTILSGNRQVKFKTDFPSVFKLFFNTITLFPFHIVQKMFRNNKNSLVIYAEFKNGK